MKKLLIFLAILVIASMAVQTYLVHNFVYQTQESLVVDGKTTQASVGLCITPPEPYLNTTCLEAFNQSTSIENNSYECVFKGEDGINSTIKQNIMFPEASGLFINYSEETDTIRFDANNTGVGTYDIDYEFRNEEGSCDIGVVDTFTFQVLFINDPPEFRGQIADRQLDEGTSLSIFFLEDHFSDPDNTLDELNFSVHNTNNFDVFINQSTREIVINNPSGNCDNDIVFFQAKDPGNLTAESNPVTLESVCEESPERTGGGGGAPRECTSDWTCNSWQECRPDGTQIRECIDINACDPDNFRVTQERECEYEEFDEEEEPEREDDDEEDEEDSESRPLDIQQPRLTQGDEDLTLLYMILALLTVSSGLAVMFKNQVKKAYLSLMWYLTRKKHKQKILKTQHKQTLLGQVEKLEQTVAASSQKIYKTTDNVVKEVTKAYREYFSKITNMQFEFPQTEFKEKIDNVLNENLKKALKLGQNKNLKLETNKVNLSKNHLMLLIEELRLFTLVTSKTKAQDYNYFVRNMPVKGDKKSKVLRLLFNSVQALQFEKVEDAKQKYFDAMQLLETLPKKIKDDMSEDVDKIYSILSYVIEYTKK